MSFDRKTYRRAIETSAAMYQFGHEREKFLLDNLVHEAELRYKAEHVTKSLASVVDETLPHAAPFNPFLEQDRREVALGRRQRGTPEDPDNGPYCSACGHYHGGMC